MSTFRDYSTTMVGSFPHPDAHALSRRLAGALDIPVWPQLPRRTFYENMYTQFSAALPALTVDPVRQKIMFEVNEEILVVAEVFYSAYLQDDVEAFSLSEEYAAGFHALLHALAEVPGVWAKGQVIGPVSFGLTVTDQNGRASLYDELLADVIVKNVQMNARWQINHLQTVRPNTLIFVDEPYMASFGSAYVSLERDQVVTMLNEVFDAIHAAGSLAGVHCCANTDWSVLMATHVDVLNLDAYGFLDTLALYPAELRAFLDRGGTIAWGIVPNTEQAMDMTPLELAARLRQGFALIEEKAGRRGVQISHRDLSAGSLLTPSCGLGPTTIDVAERVLELLIATADILRST